MRKINTGRIGELIIMAVWMPIGIIFGIYTDLRQIWIIRVRKPDFAWVIFKHDEEKLLKALEIKFPAGKASPRDVLLFSQQQKVASTTYVGEKHVTIHARAWVPSPWRFFSLVAFKWIVTFRFSEELVHISNPRSESVRVASELLRAERLPDTFQSASLHSIILRCEYAGV